MTSIKKTIIFVLGWLLLIFLGWTIVYAATSYRVGVGAGQSTNVYGPGACKKVTNNCSWDIFIPTNTTGEWSSFQSYKPACVPSLDNCVTRVYTNTVTPNGYYLSTYDDFRLGAVDFCQQFGYNTSTGNYQCGTATTNGSVPCSPSSLNYRHNGGWGVFNLSYYDVSYSCGSTYGSNWCNGLRQYLYWVDCITY